MAFDLSKFLARFVEEAREHVEKLNAGLVLLEKDPDDTENINAIFRSAHTLKGSSRMMKLTPITEVAHKVEDALGALREKKIRHSRELADLLFRGIDTISAMIEKTAEGQAIETDSSTLCEDLMKAAEGFFAGMPVHAGKEEMSSALPQVNVSGSAGVPNEGAEAPVTETLRETPGEGRQREGTRPSEQSPPEQSTARGGKAGETVRINAEKLDELIKLVGEIVSNQNRLKQRLADVKDMERIANRCIRLASRLDQQDAENGEGILSMTRSLFVKSRQLVSQVKDDAVLQELLTGELQDKALVFRMVPLSTVFDSLHRMVRDIAHAMGKEVDLIIEGSEIELDKKMVEKLGDPLVHMLRNAIDHGIEERGERRLAGKTERGTVRVSAGYDAGSVVIEVSDDGRGIPLEKIKERALRKKMLSADAVEGMSEAALVDLIFHPGFSTSTIITDVSGRGVGMDVVKRNIVEELGGAIGIETGEGRGTTFSLRLPLTLAIMRLLLVTVSGTPLALPAHYASEIIRVPESRLITVVDKRAVRLREEFIPMAALDALLKLPGRGPAPPARPGGDVLILIVYVGNEKLGLVIDALLDEEDRVIKTLPAHMKGIQLVSGVTLSGKSEIINVLNVPAVIAAAREVKETKPSRDGMKEEGSAVHILVVDDSVNTREIEKSILEAYGYRVTLAGDGREALEKTREFRYDLVITDVEMPHLDGFSLTERLRSDSTYRGTPIIIVTSREKEEDKRKGIQVGADAYIVKGAFDQSNLLETIQNLVG